MSPETYQRSTEEREPATRRYLLRGAARLETLRFRRAAIFSRRPGCANIVVARTARRSAREGSQGIRRGRARRARSQRRALRDAAGRSTRRLVEQQTQRHPMTPQAKKRSRKMAQVGSAGTAEDRIAEASLDNRKSGRVPTSTEGGSAEARTTAATPPVEKETANAFVMPLEYMLSVMRDPAVEPARRDEMAKLALPYLHPEADRGRTHRQERRNARYYGPIGNRHRAANRFHHGIRTAGKGKPVSASRGSAWPRRLFPTGLSRWDRSGGLLMQACSISRRNSSSFRFCRARKPSDPPGATPAMM